MGAMEERLACLHCRKEYDKSALRKLKVANQQIKYECVPCSTKLRTGSYSQVLSGKADVPRQKNPYYCQRCNYHFKSQSVQCPYCSKDDTVVRGDISVNDLL